MNANMEVNGKKLVLVPIYSGTAVALTKDLLSRSSQAIFSEHLLPTLTLRESTTLTKSFYTRHFPLQDPALCLP